MFVNNQTNTFNEVDDICENEQTFHPVQTTEKDQDPEPSADQDPEPSADQDKENTRNQLNEIIQIVCRQTELTEEEAIERLEKEQYNHMKVLNDYFGFKEVKHENKSSINQQIYGEIRILMDTSSRNFRLEQENAQCIQKLKETRDVNKE